MVGILDLLTSGQQIQIDQIELTPYAAFALPPCSSSMIAASFSITHFVLSFNEVNMFRDMLFLWFIVGVDLSCLFYLLLLNQKSFLVGERRVLSDALFPVSVLSSMATSTSILT